MEEQKQQLNLPRTENPLYQFNPETKMFWIGIPVDKMDSFSAALLLDRMKSEFAFFKSQLIAQRQNIIISSKQKFKEFISKFKK